MANQYAINRRNQQTLQEANQNIRIGLQMMGAADRYKKQDEMAERQEKRAEELDKMRETQFAREQEEYKRKKAFEVVKKKWEVARALYESGNIRGAAAGLSKLLSEDYPDGDEVGIVFREDALNDQNARKIFEVPGHENKQIAVFSKDSGMLPFNTMEDLMKYVAANLNIESYSKEMSDALARVEDANAKEAPYEGQDGEIYVNTWVLGPGGRLRRGEPKRYTGRKESLPAPKKTKMEEDVIGLKKVLGDDNVTREDKEIVAGIREKKKVEKPKEPEKQKTPDIGKLRDADAKTLANILAPMTGNKTTIDEFGNITKEGINALNRAYEIVRKADSNEKLTAEEKQYLKTSRRATAFHEKKSGEYMEEEGINIKPPWKEYDTKRPGLPVGAVPSHKRPGIKR